MAVLRILALPDLVPGFRLAGVRTIETASADHAAATLRSELAESAPGVIGVDERLLERLDPVLRARLESSLAPLVLAVPSGLRGQSVRDRRDRLADLLRRAVGYHITFPGAES